MLYPLVSTLIKATRLHRNENKSESLYFSIITAGMKMTLKMARLVVGPPSKQNSNTSQVKLLQCAAMPPSGPQLSALSMTFSFSTKTGGLKME
jgi:hypothetical protein